MGRGRPNGNSGTPPTEVHTPIDWPMPALTMRQFVFRILPEAGKGGQFIFRVTPAMQVGPQEFAPTTDTHFDFVFTVDSFVNLADQLTRVMEPEQLTLVRAALSSITMPDRTISIPDTIPPEEM